MCAFSFFLLYREEEKNYSSIDRKYTVKQDLPTISQTSHNRTTTPANQWVELDSNPNTSNQSTFSPSSSQEKGHNGGSTSTPDRNIELEAASHLLKKQEKSLCIQLDLKPTQYLTQKALLLQVRSDKYRFAFIVVTVMYNLLILFLMLQEYLNGNRRSSIVPQSELESKILHYLVTSGWIAAN